MAEGISAPVPQVITSKKDRRNYGVGLPYSDAYNQSAMAKYNNDYNYWLWKQQMEYNSPVEQRKRMEAAGLNPNYQSVDGGNVSSIPSSSGNISPSIGANSQRSLQNALSVANGILDSVQHGIHSMSELSGIPTDIRSYRRYLKEVGLYNRNTSEYRSLSAAIDAAYDAWFKGGIEDPQRLIYYGWTDRTGNVMSDVLNPKNSPLGQQNVLRNAAMDLMNQLRQYDLDNIKPLEVAKLNEEIRRIGALAGLTEEELRLYTLTQGSKIFDTVGRFILAILKK